MRIAGIALVALLLAVPSALKAQRRIAFEGSLSAAIPHGSFGTDTANLGIGLEGLAELFIAPVGVYSALSVNRFATQRRFAGNYVIAARLEAGLRYRVRLGGGAAFVGAGPLYGSLFTKGEGFREGSYARAFGWGAHAAAGFPVARKFALQLKARHARFSPRYTETWIDWITSPGDTIGTWHVGTVAYTSVELGARYDLR